MLGCLVIITVLAANDSSNFSSEENKSNGKVEYEILKLDNAYYFSKYNISSKKGKKLTLTTLEEFEKDQNIIIEFETNVNLTKWQNDLKGKKLGKYISKKAGKEEISFLLDNEDVKKIWPDRHVNITVNGASAIVGSSNFHQIGIGNGVKTCVLDTGVLLEHSMLFDSEIIYADFTGEGFFDGHGHGTHVATTLLGNDLAYTGIAPGAILYAGKVLDSSGSGLLSWVLEGMDWCINNNVSVISMSLGATYPEEPEELLDAPEILKVKEAVEKGIVVVIASGNSGAGMVTTPGISLDAITVGAVTKQNESVAFSGLDYINGILKPDLVAPGVDICAGGLDGYSCLTGTSMATPIVSGLAVLLVEKGVNDVRAYLINHLMDISLDFGLAHISIDEDGSNVTGLPEIKSFNVYSGFIDDGINFILNVNNSNYIELLIGDDYFTFNDSFNFIYYPINDGIYNYTLIVSNKEGEIINEGSFEVLNYKFIIPTFELGVIDYVKLYHKNTGSKGKIPVSISIKDVNDNYIELNKDRMYNENKTHYYELEFTPSLPGKYNVLIRIGDEAIDTTLETFTPMMTKTISPMRVKIR